MKIAAIIPVKTFALAKSRLEISDEKKEEICKIMLEEILFTLSISPKINKLVVVTKEEKAIELCKKYGGIHVLDLKENGVNGAIELADKYILDNNFDASIIFPQDIPLIKTQDIDFLLKHQSPPNFAIIVPSRRFDGTNALARMPVNLMSTHYDEDSYKIHMVKAKEHTRNTSLVFVKRIMLDVDNMEDLKFLLSQNEKPQINEKIKKTIEQN